MGKRKSYADDHLLQRTPVLRGVIERLGLAPRSFRRFVVEGAEGGYSKTLGALIIKPDGRPEVSGDIDSLTDTEVASITAEVGAANWPTSIGAPHGDLPAELRGKDGAGIFEFRSIDGKKTLFIQHRTDVKGNKAYFPWSYWSDAQWRQMEPDGLLPLYGLNKIKNNTTVFAHEGPKSAHYVQWMIERETPAAKKAYSDCPWAEELSNAAHVGWAGGAPNPQRTDWSALKRKGITRVFVVADNDQIGQKAISKISSLSRLPMTAIVFDDRFPAGFDLADAWPPNLWSGKRYIGPRFHDMCRPATWATKKGEPHGKGRPPIFLKPECAEEWIMVQTPHVFVHRAHPHIMFSPEMFNREMAPFSDTDDLARLIAKEFQTHADGITYRPHRIGNSERLITIDGQRLINTYRPPAIFPVEGDAGPFLEFMNRFIPDEGDRRKVMRWCATLIARPEVRMRYALLLISSVQGTGKSTLSDAILAPLVGRWNVSAPTEKIITESQFNGWNAHKRLAIISEIYSGETRKCYDRLKGVITDDNIEVNKKYMEPYSIENWTHVAASSNSTIAIHLDGEDRRWLVPGLTGEVAPSKYWEDFYRWLNGGGLSIIAAWAEAYVCNEGAVATGERAPDTTQKKEVIEASRSVGQQIAYDLAVEACASKTPIVLLVNDVWQHVAARRPMSDSRMERPLTLRKALVAGGLKEPLRRPDAKDNRIKTDSGPQYVVATFDIGIGSTWGDIKKYRKFPQEIEAMGMKETEVM